MKRGELYRVHRGSPRDPRDHRVFVVVSRKELIDSAFSAVVCAPVYSAGHGLESQVLIGIDEGLKYDSFIHCDELMTIPKVKLTNYVGSLSPAKTIALNRALSVAVGID